MSCPHCDAIERGEIIEETQYAVVTLATKPATQGHITVAPKRHVAIIEQLEDYEMAQLASLANKFSIVAFEKLYLYKMEFQQDKLFPTFQSTYCQEWKEINCLCNGIQDKSAKRI